MADEPQPEKIWDEYDWERFLQQQDRKTEKYMELLEKYIDHPERDQIIAREMGWTHLLNDDGERWAEEVEELFEEEMQAVSTTERAMMMTMPTRTNPKTMITKSTRFTRQRSRSRSGSISFSTNARKFSSTPQPSSSRRRLRFAVRSWQPPSATMISTRSA